jgi:hypothetical protein
MLSRDPNQRRFVGRAIHDTLGNVSVEETIEYDPPAQIGHVDWYWSTEAKKDFWTTPLEMRVIFPQEMPLLITAGGIRLVERFGDFDRSPFMAGSPRQVCVCEMV